MSLQQLVDAGCLDFRRTSARELNTHSFVIEAPVGMDLVEPLLDFIMRSESPLQNLTDDGSNSPKNQNL